MKFVSLVSSGIDSPVATYLLSKKAKELILVHADNRPFTDDRETQNFIKLSIHLKKIIPCKIKSYKLSHGKTLTIYKQKAEHRFTCVFCKRMLVRYAEEIAKKEKADAIIMGDSLGQVASQTLQNIRVVDQAATIPILRPLIGFDKEGVVKIAKDIGTYDLSILPSAGCSAVPNKPSTMAKLDKIIEEESKINIDDLVKFSVDNIELIKL